MTPGVLGTQGGHSDNGEVLTDRYPNSSWSSINRQMTQGDTLGAWEVNRAIDLLFLPIFVIQSQAETKQQTPYRRTRRKSAVSNPAPRCCLRRHTRCHFWYGFITVSCTSAEPRRTQLQLSKSLLHKLIPQIHFAVLTSKLILT